MPGVYLMVPLKTTWLNHPLRRTVQIRLIPYFATRHIQHQHRARCKASGGISLGAVIKHPQRRQLCQ